MKKKRLGLGIAAALAAMSFGQQAYGQAAPPWNLNGSDTWHDVIVQALTTANANCPGTNLTNTISNLVYLGGGSGTAETNMGNNAQSIGPMSRNFKQAVLTAHPTWAPTLQNVGGRGCGCHHHQEHHEAHQEHPTSDSGRGVEPSGHE